MAVKDWTELFKSFAGQWVALRDDEVTVIAYGKNIHKVLEKARNAGFDKPILIKVPTEMLPYVGCV